MARATSHLVGVTAMPPPIPVLGSNVSSGGRPVVGATTLGTVGSSVVWQTSGPSSTPSGVERAHRGASLMTSGGSRLGDAGVVDGDSVASVMVGVAVGSVVVGVTEVAGFAVVVGMPVRVAVGVRHGPKCTNSPFAR